MSDRYPATSAQESLFSHYEMHPADDALDLRFLFRLDGDLDIQRLAESFRRMLDRAPGLATVFRRERSGVVAHVLSSAGAVTVLDVPAGVDAETWVQDFAEADQKGGRIDPRDPDPVRVTIFAAAECAFVLLRASHLVGDAYSFYQAVGLVTQLYSAPDSEWDVLLESLRHHPGTIAQRPPSARALSAYAQLMEPVTQVHHDTLSPRRIGGRILGNNTFLSLSGESFETLRDSPLVQKWGAASVFFAAYASMLQRLEDAPDVVIGVPLANRFGREARSAVGYFVNTFPLPVHIDHDTTWSSLCAQISAGLRVLQGCQGLDPNSSEGREVFPSTGWSPDNAVTFYKQGLLLKLPGVRTVPLQMSRPSLTHPLTMNVADQRTSFEVELCVHDRLSDVDVAGLIRDSLRELATEPEARVITGSLTGADPAEIDVPSPRPTSLIALIHRACQTDPSRVAVRDADVCWTYRDLWQRAEAVASWLERVQATDFVIVRCSKSAHSVAAVLGVLLSGRAYVPVEANGATRREQLIRSRVAMAQGCVPTVLDDPVKACEQVDPPPVIPQDVGGGERPAYVIFTSGSTGEPKGVVVPHGNVVDLLVSTTKDFAFGPDDVWCLFHSLAFDFSVWEMFGALTTGARLEIPAADQVRSPRATAAWLARVGVTVLNQTPSAFRRLGPLFESGMQLPDVRMVIFGGETLHPSDLLPWWSCVGSRARVVNMYGITETTVHVTAREMRREDLTHSRSLIGDALAHLDLQVLDSAGRPRPVGLVGEIYVTGTGLARGYLGHPELTAERFVPITGPRGVQRAYRSGDLARRTADGELEIFGRKDHQVQLRGYRIELGEIEAALLRIPQVGEAVVSLETPRDAEPYLAAWVVGPQEAASVRSGLSAQLPDYMQPSQIICVHGIPTNQSGKPDLPALRALAVDRAGEDRTAPPDSGLAARIAVIWEETIGAGPVSLGSHFLEVGGTSMHVMAIHERICAEPEASHFDVVDLFEFSTPTALANHLLGTDSEQKAMVS